MELANIAGPLISMLGNVALVSITLGRSALANITEQAEEEIEEIEQFIGSSVSEQDGS